MAKQDKPCPFCGSETLVMADDMDFRFLSCVDCQAAGPMKHYDDYRGVEELNKAAWAAWNRRPK